MMTTKILRELHYATLQTTLWTEKHTKMFLMYSLQNLTDCDKIWHIYKKHYPD